ncbi:MAG: putative membrane protein [Candidatus Methanohalarchaeum thermophilum]|uniref:Membrane protein n=1 Tax=Methanohalarchaeum thermophilum TaxID=1903181 RepID=A0A1Q6DS89_METT1|nr:MAG: putative membrane protein [Candidatus Methanohalarchaeum thermophilum]
MKRITSNLPGVVFLFAVGLIAKLIGQQIPHVSYLIIAIALGVMIANVLDLPDSIELGINNTYKIWLETGIVILGGRIVASRIFQIGPTMFALIITFLVLSLLLTEFLARKFNLKQKLGTLLAVGTSLCGVSAIIATTGGIKAKERHLIYAVATILLFDTITVFAYPFTGKIFSIPTQVYGIWTGISMFSTGTAVAAGFAFSEAAGKFATIAKMTRNVFIGLAALLYSIIYLKKEESDLEVNKLTYIWNKFPKFIFGFLLAMALASFGLFNETQIQSIKNAYHWMFMLAFVGMGYNMKYKELKKAGLKPVIVVSIAFIIISALSLLASFIFFG